MPDTGWTIAGSGASDSGNGGSYPWLNPSRVTADDASETYTDDSSEKFAYSEYIKGYNFGLSVPTNATITGIEIRGQFRDTVTADTAQSGITEARVVHPTSGYGDDQETVGTDLDTTATNYDYGGSTELHGKSWTPANINSSSFGVVFELLLGVNGPLPVNPRCDAIWVKVYYNVPAGDQFYIYG